jgi:hypothetical protein
MNICILGNSKAVERQNVQKVFSHTRAKAQREWDELIIVAQQCPPLPRPILVKLTSQQLLKVFNFNVCDVGSMPRDVTSWMETDEDL